MDMHAIEKKWQKKWEETKAFETEPSNKEKYYMLFAYPTASGNLHVGHARSYSIPDIIARYKRMRGFNVFFPLGFHATGGDCQKICDKIANDPAAGEAYGIPRAEAKNLKTAINVERYLEKSMINSFKTIGLSLDYRPAVSTIDPQYGKFIEWQFRKLKETGHLIQKAYRLAWCPRCNGPVSLVPAESDISEWKGAQIKDYTIIKFKSNGLIFPAATMRPETIFGVTNIWINPNDKYVKAKVDSEEWVIAEKAVDKLKHLGKEVSVLSTMRGKDFLGMKVFNPMTELNVPVMYGEFASTDEATGIVMSVPAHDPYDYMYMIRADPHAKPIKVVDLPGFGNAPAGELIEKHHIHDATDPRIEEVKNELYKMENEAKMFTTAGRFSGMPVKEAKKAISDWLFKLNNADYIYELSVKPIYCRCGGEIIIKAVKDQWFIDYGNLKWKELAKECASGMNLYPPEYKNELPGIIDWLEARPCVRRKGLGTKFPFNPEWVIEALSDSTIYMAFFIVSKHFNAGKIKLDEMDDKFFDYVFHGKGTPRTPAWKKVRDEFMYWYPLDLNCGGKEHKSVHFPFFIFTHAAIFPKVHWPRGVFVNWHVVAYGKKISKSKGNVVFWKDAIEKYGADAVRLYMAHGSNQWSDFDWKNEECEIYSKHTEALYKLFDDLMSKRSATKSAMDKWMRSRLNHIIEEATHAMDSMEIKKAVDKIFFGVMNDLNWYVKRTDKYNIGEVLEAWAKMLLPFMPHAAEEMWSRLGNKNSVMLEKWPAYNPKAINLKVEAAEDIVKKTMADIEQIKKLSKIARPKKISIFISSPWKYEIYRLIVEGKTMKDIMKIQKYQKIGNAVPAYINKLLKRMPLDELFLTEGSEHSHLEEAKGFFEKIYGCKIEIIGGGKAKHPKADAAEPGKPGILVE